MKIKKINDDKVQIIITSQDLEERNFKKWEFVPITPKAQELFLDLLDIAYHECGFEIEDDSQLMVEAYPLTVDSIVVVMTKVRTSSQAGEYLNLFFPYQQEAEEDEAEEVGLERGNRQVWSFDDIEMCSRACARLVPDVVDESALYKYGEKYYLFVALISQAPTDALAVLGEYGDWVPATETFFSEHAERLIAANAVTNLASLIR